MTSQLDHLVIGGSDLGLLVAWWKHVSGVDPQRGGVHEGHGTHNALVGVDARTYVELIAHDPGQPNPAGPRPFGLDQLEPDSVRLCTFVVAVDDIDAAASRVRSAGLDPGEIMAMNRERRDGHPLRWRLAIPPDQGMQGTLPALIQWDAGVPHPGSSLGSQVEITELVIGHDRPDDLQAAFDALDLALPVNSTPAPMLAVHFSVPDGPEFWL